LVTFPARVKIKFEDKSDQLKEQYLLKIEKKHETRKRQAVFFLVFFSRKKVSNSADQNRNLLRVSLSSFYSRRDILLAILAPSPSSPDAPLTTCFFVFQKV